METQRAYIPEHFHVIAPPVRLKLALRQGKLQKGPRLMLLRDRANRKATLSRWKGIGIGICAVPLIDLHSLLLHSAKPPR